MSGNKIPRRSFWLDNRLHQTADTTVTLTSERSLLFLCHRIPFPPDKGEKIRAFRILEHLARNFRVHLGFFVDDPNDMQHVDALKPYCAGLKAVPLSPIVAKMRAIGGLLTGQPLSVASFSNAAMQDWVRDVLKTDPPTVVFVYSSAMAQFVMDEPLGAARLIMDFVDVDSDKFRQYAKAARPPMSWVYAYEARKLLEFDRRVARKADASLLVSDAEAALFRDLVPEAATRIHAVSNGIDCEFFSPLHEFPTPFKTAGPHFVFTGTMDYRPNIDAVVWFAKEIFPTIRNKHPAATFTVVGAKPTPQVQNLAAQPNVFVTGRVADVRPYLAYADVVVGPLRMARGIQNKILEGMAMAKPVVTTAQGLEGITAVPGQHVLVADTAADFAAAALKAAEAGSRVLGPAARALMESTYSWQGRLSPLNEHTA